LRTDTKQVASEAGAGSILALAILISTLGLLSAGALIGQQALEKTRLSSTTEAIALAAADALRGVISGYPCIVAKDMAANNQVALDRCRIVGLEVFIETSSKSSGARAVARAGPP
jgi:secretion/DNA translocation related TadE-like protein